MDMENHDIPSSPLQRRRHPDANTSSPPENESVKLNLAPSATTVSVPNQSCSSPVATSSMAPWSASEPDNSPLYESTPWRWQGQGSSTQPMPPTARCPSPQSFDEPLPHSASFISAHIGMSDLLNRSASHNSSPAPIFTPPRGFRNTTTPLKRTRASSLPLSTPTFKRLKTRHDTPTPSDTWIRSMETIKSPSKLEIQEKKAEELGRNLMTRRKAPVKVWNKYDQILVACNMPPINLSTLRALDATEILKNPQLRHDLLFDSLAFRPATSVKVQLDGGRVPMVDGPSSTLVAEMYWESISEELKSGCRCTRWRVIGEGGPDAVWKSLAGKERVNHCVCGGWMTELNTESEWWAWQKCRWSSRIPGLVETLRELLISLMGSTTPCPSHYAHSFSREALDAHEARCPVVTHALVPELYAALDPEFITAQIRRGVFGTSIFKMLGDAMKVHCAPVRDKMVDDMVKTALVRGQEAMGLMKAFDCVEVMKLDIANHQVHALRPHLWTTASASEYTAFQNLLTTSQLTLENSLTRKWIKSASMRVLSLRSPEMRKALMKKGDEHVSRALVEGWLELVFANWSGAGEQQGTAAPIWPPTTYRRLGGSTTTQQLQFAEGTFTCNVNLPESLKMDSRRLKNFNADVIDLAIQYTALIAVKEMVKVAHPHIVARELGVVMDKAREDIQSTLDTNGTIVDDTVLESVDDISDLAIRLANRIVYPTRASISTSTSTSDSNLQVEQVSVSVSSAAQVTRIHIIASKLDEYLRTNIQPTSPRFLASMNHLRRELSSVLTVHLLKKDINTNSDHSSNRAGSAMEVDYFGLEREVRELGRKMYRIVGFHLGVFKDVYKGRGMIVGA